RGEVASERCGVVCEVGLVDDDDRPGAGCAGDREVALDPASVEVAAGGGHDEDRIDVRRDDLVGAVTPRAPPLKEGLSWEDIDDRRCTGLWLMEQDDKVPLCREAAESPECPGDPDRDR